MIKGFNTVNGKYCCNNPKAYVGFVDPVVSIP